jgi:hypothetical protein
MAFEKDAQLVQYLVGHHVDEHATPFRVEPIGSRSGK